MNDDSKCFLRVQNWFIRKCLQWKICSFYHYGIYYGVFPIMGIMHPDIFIYFLLFRLPPCIIQWEEEDHDHRILLGHSGNGHTQPGCPRTGVLQGARIPCTGRIPPAATSTSWTHQLYGGSVNTHAHTPPHTVLCQTFSHSFGHLSHMCDLNCCYQA